MNSALTGFLNINKPSAMTSHDVVQRLRRIVGTKHVGHGGTLDPMAQGVLPVAIGPACRLLRYVSSAKVYKADFLFGTTTTTDDTTGEILKVTRQDTWPLKDEIEQALSRFVGVLDQVPPSFSAVHHEGKRLYELARQGVVIANRPARRVVVETIDLLSYCAPEAVVRISCGGGTYIRSLARDVGELIGLGGCLSALVREQSGPFNLTEALTLEELKQAKEEGNLSACIMTPQEVLSVSTSLFPLSVDTDSAKKIGSGQRVEHSGIPLEFAGSECRVLVTSSGSFLAICEFDGKQLHAEVVIASGIT